MNRPSRHEQLSDLTSQLNRVQQELFLANEAGDATVQSPDEATQPPASMTLVESLSELSTTIEELLIAEEEIHQHNEELQAALTKVEEERMRYRELFDYAPEAYLLTDINGIILEANHATTDLLNATAHILIRKPLVVFVNPESKHAFYRLMVTARDSKTRKIDEFMLNPLHQPAVTVEFTVLTTRDAKGMPIAQRWLLRDVSRRKLVEAELEQTRQQTQAFAANIQTAREDERTRVAREIHDELGQTLTGLRLDIGMLKKQVPAEMTELHGKLDQISITVVDAIQSVRRIMTDLRPSVLDEAGLIAAMEWQCRDFRTRTGIHCRFLSKESNLDLYGEGTNAIFRLSQEMLTNVAKHSGASRVSVELKQGREWVQLEVRDNGRGITEEEINNPVTSGLLGMRERVRLLNGKIDFHGMPKRGTRIRVRLPRHSRQRDAKEVESSDA